MDTMIVVKLKLSISNNITEKMFYLLATQFFLHIQLPWVVVWFGFDDFPNTNIKESLRMFTKSFDYRKIKANNLHQGYESNIT